MCLKYYLFGYNLGPITENVLQKERAYTSSGNFRHTIISFEDLKRENPVLQVFFQPVTREKTPSDLRTDSIPLKSMKIFTSVKMGL